MKKQTLLLALLAFAFTQANAGTITKSENLAAYSLQFSSLSDAEISAYMMSTFGETVTEVIYPTGQNYVIVETESNRSFYLYIENGLVIKAIEVPID